MEPFSAVLVSNDVSAASITGRVFDDYDVKYPSMGPSDIVFQAGDRMYLLDLASEKTREVPTQVVTDRSTLRCARSRK